MAAAKFPVTAAIQKNLEEAFYPIHLEVINESHKHKVPKDSETHFKVVVVSPEFEKTKTLIQRHRLVNDALSEQLEGPVHALSIVAKTPAQWEKMVEAATPAVQGLMHVNRRRTIHFGPMRCRPRHRNHADGSPALEFAAVLPVTLGGGLMILTCERARLMIPPYLAIEIHMHTCFGYTRQPER